MNNDPELSGKYLGTITQDFVILCDDLKEASYQLRVREISKYPIFVMSKWPISIGALLHAKHETLTDWNYYFSYLEDFVQRELVLEDRLEDFIHAYKDPDEFCCLFVADESFNNFVFVPYPID